ncbi:MAG: ligase-associated DNA damage response endonuclease PdeM [Saprospiraceae bacterium]|nr:ligase-associated DNA damage response endonuclease PdeM [Saprospiraceae bacterium]
MSRVDQQTVVTVTVRVRDQHLLLLPDRLAYWVEQGLLILADLHLGKAQHFRKNGIPVPGNVLRHELRRLAGHIEQIQPQQTWILGDLSHSVYNKGWEEAITFFSAYPAGFWHLVPGNHDIMQREQYERAGIVVEKPLVAHGPFALTHQLLAQAGDLYQVAGHVHPGVRLQGKASQAITLPCFFFKPAYALLPAFGRFTGLGRVEPEPGDQVYAIAEGQILDLSPQSGSA